MTAQALLTFLYQSQVAITVEQGDLFLDDPGGVLNEELITQIKIHKSALIALIAKLAAANNSLKPEQAELTFPHSSDCSLAQKRMLFMESLAEQGSFYNMPFAYRLTGELKVSALYAAFVKLINKHDILRTRFSLNDGEYFQHVQDHIACQSEQFNIERHDICALRKKEQTSFVQSCLQQEAEYSYDLTQQFPIKVALIELNQQEFVLSINIHHIAADGWSARNIIRDLNEAYRESLTATAEASLFVPPPCYQYTDYVAWQKKWLQSPSFYEAKAYWLEQLKGLPELHNFPLDYTRPASLAVDGDIYSHLLSDLSRTGLNDFAKAHDTRLFVVLQALFAAFLARYSDDEDIVFGTAVANRQPQEFVDSVGLFVNTLVLRYAVNENSSLTDLVQQAKLTNQAALKYQEYPFDELVELLNPKRSLGYNPLIQIMLVMQDESTDLLDFSGTQTEVISQHQAVAKFDFTLHVKVSGNLLAFNWEYNTSLFNADTIVDIASKFEAFIVRFLSAPTKPFSQISVVSEEAIAKADTALFPAALPIHQLFDDNAETSPHALAVSEGDRLLTYQALSSQVEHLAAQLIKLSVKQGQSVAVCMEKSVELVVSMLAIFKVGAVYVPIDPSYPQDRIDYMLQDSGAQCLLTNLTTKLTVSDDVHFAHKVEELLAAPKTQAEFSVITAKDAAYVIYTSGSTGKPKGVEVPHQSLFYSLQANKLALQFDQKDIMPTIGSQAFGVSLLEILLPLISGAQVQITSKEQVRDLEQLIEYTKPVTVLHAVPSIMAHWLDLVSQGNKEDCYPDLRLLLVGAEPVPDALIKKVKQWRPNVKLLVLYGMTESSVVSCSYEATPYTPACYCIGQPHANTEFYVLNKQGQLQPKGVPGELHVGGLSLANKYLNLAELTEQRFIENPFIKGQRLYKTGDRVRCLTDGKYEFLGRIDNQVSLRGVRIELGEIESLALIITGVKQVIVDVITKDDGDKLLVLYYSTELSSSQNSELSGVIQSTLAEKLPEYMMPSVIQYLEQLPVNPNGKVDRKQLPVPECKGTIVEPTNDLERQLLIFWQELLQNDNVSIEDNFFEIGGHSLLATKLISRVRSHFDVSLPIAALFKSPTIKTCALVLEQALKEKYSEILRADSETEHGDLVDELIL